MNSLHKKTRYVSLEFAIPNLSLISFHIYQKTLKLTFRNVFSVQSNPLNLYLNIVNSQSLFDCRKTEIKCRY